jgi:hypothetical protein
MRIAFYKATNGNYLDKIIAWWTRPSFFKVFTPANYSHVEMVFSNGECFSSSPRDGGARWKNIDVESGNWDFINTPNINEDTVRALCNREEGKKYDWLCIFFGFVFPFDIQDPHKWICSEITGKLAFKMEQPHRNHPQKLYDILKIYYLI